MKKYILLVCLVLGVLLSVYISSSNQVKADYCDDTYMKSELPIECPE